MAHSDNARRGYNSAHRRGRNFKKNYRVPRVRMERRDASTALASGREPEPLTRGMRHSALWDRF